ncbi:DUF4365 domain-containing protein [Tautonia plasticadhaerens]|uniref:DUF4365 domain-containing protein n=1 Tax=Tautonia plasticadhaerens TaxID=2527974 RepID=A0A518GYN0_9BACT|nr:DUF4365 domain-containing protein [Tautonia plasticadhaerens]QDV33709.1 hypothetical protein ElP_15860 [Tautonia plasticadhaerens]
MMDLSQRKEQWSEVYLRAIATAAGYTLHEPRVDDDSIDFAIAGRIVADLPCPPRIDVQLKGTSDFAVRDDHVVYRLKRKNYDDLRYTELLVPRLLIVVLIPKAEADWLRHSVEELAIRRCGYWANLAGLGPATQKGDKVPVRLPRANIFSVEGLRDLMRRSARRETL